MTQNRRSDFFQFAIPPARKDCVFVVITFKKAEELAMTWVRIATNNSCEISRIDDKPYGWVFHYHSKNHDPNDYKNFVLGNAPIIVDRINFEVVVTGTAHPLDYYIEEYERSLPEERLQMAPERHDGVKKYGQNDR